MAHFLKKSTLMLPYSQIKKLFCYTKFKSGTCIPRLTCVNMNIPDSLKYRPNLASFCLFFVLFSMTNDRQYIILLYKSVDDVLGIGTQDRRMVGADKSTELRRPPTFQILFYKLLVPTYNVEKMTVVSSKKVKKCSIKCPIDKQQNRGVLCL